MKSIWLLLCVTLLSLACGLGPDMNKDRIPRTPSPTPFVPERPIAEYMSEGGAAFAAGNFSQAVDNYKRAFEIEQREQKLDKKQRRELISNLATAYAKSGETDKARLVIAYGVSKDYDAPTYHYALACSYASEGDESSTLHHLRKAFKFRNKVIAGEKLADPLNDSCFADFADGETFKTAVADMKRSKPQP